jgi:hypothetical protein
MFSRVAMAGTVLMALLTGCSGNFHLGEFIKLFRSGAMVDADHGVLLYGLDMLTTPGSRVQLKARLRSPRSLEGIEGVRISFRENGRLLGEAITDESGVVEIDCSIGAAGPHMIDIVPTKLPRTIDEDYNQTLQARARMLVDAQPADAKFIVVDLDHTLVDAGGGNVLIESDSREMGHAVDVMRRIGESYHVIYLTHRPRAMTSKSGQWLREHKMPLGVLLSAPGESFLESNEKYKSAALAELRKTYSCIEIGVGDQASDAAAYLANNMTPYLMPHCKSNPDACRKLAREILALPHQDRIQVVTGWEQIELGILNHQRYGVEEFTRGLEKVGSGKQ